MGEQRFTFEQGEAVKSRLTAIGLTMEELRDAGGLEITRGNSPGIRSVHNVGHGVLGTSLTPLTNDLVYHMPQTATSLEVLSSSPDDAVGGTGATELVITGLDATFNRAIQVVALDGTTPVPIPTALTRLAIWFVNKSGTYADTDTPSHAGVLTIREAGAGQLWSSIPITPFPLAQSSQACFTVPAGETAFLAGATAQVNANQQVDLYLFSRLNADDVSSPYTGVFRTLLRFTGVERNAGTTISAPVGTFVGPCDIVVMGQTTAGSAEVTVFMEFHLVTT